MATYGTDLNVFDLADANTNWSELNGHASGGAPAADTENFFHNSISVSQTTGQASGTNAGMECDYGSAITWTAGWVIMAWQYYTAPTNIQTWANGGMRIGVGSSAGNMDYWNAMGSDFGNAPKECWQNTAIDPSDPSGATFSWLAADGTADGSPSGAVRLFGSLPNVLAKITKGSPHACDVVRYGRGEIYATGTGGTFAGFAAFNDITTSAGRLGLFETTRGGYLWKGLVSYGQAGTSLTFSDSDVDIILEDTPRVRADFNKQQILNASTSVTWTRVNIKGVSTANSITGSAPNAPGVFDFSVGTIDINAGTYSDLGAWEFNSNSTIDDSTFRRCKKVIQGSGAFTNVIFDGSTDTIALDVDSIADVDGCHFVSSGTGHAVDLGTVSTSATVTWKNTESGYAAQGGTAANRTILVNVATSQTLTINVATGASTPTYYNTGAGTVSVVSGQVDLVVEVRSLSTGLVIANARVYVTAGDTGDITEGTVIIDGLLTNASGIVSDTRSYTANQSIVGRVRKSTSAPFYVTGAIAGTVDKDSGFSTTIQLVLD